MTLKKEGHYCEEHQGNHSHYDMSNCTVCKLTLQVHNLSEALREQNVLFTRLDEAMADPEKIARDNAIAGGFVSTLDLTEVAEEIVDRAIVRLCIIAPMISAELTPVTPKLHIADLGASIERFQIAGRGTVFSIICPDFPISTDDIVRIDGELWKIVTIESMGEIKPSKVIGLVVKKPKQES